MIIQKIIQQSVGKENTQVKENINSGVDNTEEKYISITFVRGLSEKIKRILNFKDVIVTQKSENTAKKILHRNQNAYF